MQGAAPTADGDQAQFEADKRAVYKHPLFPLLALLLERCEQATAGAEAPAADAFGADLQAFVQHQRRDRRPFLVDDPEIDGLMIKSIQVLRIHLLELEKVQELCRDFCGRYIACLKTKMQSENLLRTDYTGGGVESNNNLSGTLDDHSSTSNSPQYQSPPAALPPPPAFPVFPHTELPFAPPHRDPQSLVVQGSTPISQIGAALLSTDSFTGTNSNNSCSSVSGSPPPEDECEDTNGKRGVLPRHATQVMRAWLFQHLVHPYPTEEEKRTLAAQTRLTLLQVNNWFINARRRILQPMLDCAEKPGGKKSKNGSSISKRYWPDALSNPQFTAGLLSSSEDEEQEGDHSGDEQEPKMAWQRPMDGYPRVWMEFVCEKTKQKLVIKDLSPEYYDIALGYMTNIFLTESAICKPLKILEDPSSRLLMQQKWLKIMRTNMSIICVCDDDEVPRVAAIHFTAIRERETQQVTKVSTTLNKYEQFSQVVEELMVAGDLFRRFGGDQLLTSLGLFVLPEYRGLGIATHILKSRILMCKALGLHGTANVFSTPGAQAAARGAGYQTLASKEFLGQNLALMGTIVPS